MVGTSLETDECQQVVGAGSARATVAPVEDHRQLDVLDGRQVGQKVARGLLPHEADHAAPVAGPFAAAHGGQVMAGDHGTAGRGRVEAAQDGEQ